MNIYYSIFNLYPKKKHHYQSTTHTQRGVFLKGVLNNKTYFAEYFPHLPLGDREVDIFLDKFKFQEVEYDQKVFHLLLQDVDFQSTIKSNIIHHDEKKHFFNHSLMTQESHLTKVQELKVAKYKIQSPQDFQFITLLESGIRVRLDANGMFHRESFEKFYEKIPKSLYQYIDYVEDPTHDQNWDHFPLPVASDFLEGSSYDFLIYKPNCRFKPENNIPAIYSSYLGHHLGKWHCYCELVNSADLSFYHGINPMGFYENEYSLFQGSHLRGFTINLKKVQMMYNELLSLEWKSLCSI